MRVPNCSSPTTATPCTPSRWRAPRHAATTPTRTPRFAAELLASTKNQAEHRYTIDMVHDTLLPWCSYLDEDAEPRIVAMANVQHLATRLEGHLSAPAASVIELMTALHPTPAVGGSPSRSGLEMIDRFEGSTATDTPDRSGGSMRPGTARGPSASAAPSSRATMPRCSPASAWLPTPIRRPSLAETRSKLQAVLGALIRP